MDLNVASIFRRIVTPIYTDSGTSIVLVMTWKSLSNTEKAAERCCLSCVLACFVLFFIIALTI